MLSLLFWKKVWNWCKVNWKFLVGFAIPCVVLYLLNQKKAVKVLQAGLEYRKKELDVVQRASDLESARVKQNAEEFADRVEEVSHRHEEAFRKLAKDGEARRKELGGSDTAELTSRLADKFNLENKDE
tara:strand:+ start:3452 stop:3835 length:384 start_codon:yes stop_codon:yes gene_type:complete